MEPFWIRSRKCPRSPLLIIFDLDSCLASSYTVVSTYAHKITLTLERSISPHLLIISRCLTCLVIPCYLFFSGVGSVFAVRNAVCSIARSNSWLISGGSMKASIRGATATLSSTMDGSELCMLDCRRRDMLSEYMASSWALGAPMTAFEATRSLRYVAAFNAR